MWQRWLTIIGLGMSVVIADAQISGSDVVHQGPVVIGNCAMWAGPLAIEDSGVSC